MSTPRVLVAGGVAAGMSAASQAKRRMPDADVVVFERGNRISYGACGMPYNIEDPERDMEDLVVLTPDQARDVRGIGLELRHEVLGADARRGILRVRDLEAGRERDEPFDSLVIATGARAVQLPLPGFDLPGVHALRTFDDGDAVKTDLKQYRPKTAVIIGAGYIGMEMAHVLTSRGLAVTVVEKLDQVIPGWSPSTAARVSSLLKEKGVRVITGAAVTEATAGPDGRVASVTVGEERLEADLVLVAVGVRPNVEVAEASDLRIGETGAIWVDQQQGTSAEGIWAAGDCAEAYHRVLRRNTWIPLGTTANKQGRIAGANLAGANQRFRGIVGTAGFTVFDLQVARTGLGLEEAKAEGFEPVSVTIRQRSRAHGFPGAATIETTIVADGPTGVVLGGELVGRDGAALRTHALAACLAFHARVDDLQNLDLVYAPPFAPVWDPVLVAANQLAKKIGSNS